MAVTWPVLCLQHPPKSEHLRQHDITLHKAPASLTDSKKLKSLCKLTGDPTCVPAPLRDDALRAAPRDLPHLPQDLQAQVQPRLPPEAVTQLTEEQDIATLPAAICAYGNPDMHLCIWEP